MSRENIVEFMNQVAESVELQATIGEEIDTEALIALGAECGCEFTAEELQESAGLSDEELDGVAGGKRGIIDPGYIIDPGHIVDPSRVGFDIGPVAKPKSSRFSFRVRRR